MKQNIKTIITIMGGIVGVATSVFFLTFVVLAWTGPLNNPPTCPEGEVGCDEPLHSGVLAQSKTGGLLLNTGGAEYGLIVDKGKVEVKTIEVSEGIKIKGVEEDLICNENNRGMMWMKQKEGDDEIMICVKNSSNEYNFNSLNKSNQSKPGAPTLSSSSLYSITLNPITNGEYRINGGEWQDSSVFNNLEIEEDYNFEQRYKGTELFSPSFVSISRSKKYKTGTNPVCSGDIISKYWNSRTC